MSKKDFQNGFALGLASGGVVEIEKEEQEKTIDITENGTTVVTPDEGMTLSEVTVNVAIESGGTELLFSSEGRCYSKNMEIPEGLTVIAAYAYDKCEQLTLKNNRLPESIIFVNQQAFWGCSNMILEKLPTNIEVIGIDAFSKTQFIGKEIPPKVRTIGNYAFANCKSITELRFKGQPTSISATAFYECSNIKHIYVPWAEGTNVGGNAPWGATNATIYYNTTYDENGNPVVTEE